MSTTVKFKNDDGKTMLNRSQQRRFKLLLPRTLAISVIVFIILMMSIIYHGIVLEHLDELKQIVALNRKHQSYHEKIKLNMASEASISLIKIPDSETVTIDNDVVKAISNTKETLDDDDARELDMQHGKIHYSRRRLSRELHDSLDPLWTKQGAQFPEIYEKIRTKRTQIALSDLEAQYTRCKKAAQGDSECMVEFVRLYNLAKELSRKMEKMVQMFEESEISLPPNSISQESNETNAQDVNALQYDADLKNTDKEGIKDAKTTKRTTPRPSRKKPAKFTWIIDGDDETEVTTKPTIITTTTTMPSSAKKPESIAFISTDISKITTAVTTDADDMIAEISSELHEETTTKLSKGEHFDWISNVKELVQQLTTPTKAIKETETSITTDRSEPKLTTRMCEEPFMSTKSESDAQDCKESTNAAVSSTTVKTYSISSSEVSSSTTPTSMAFTTFDQALDVNTTEASNFPTETTEVVQGNLGEHDANRSTDDSNETSDEFHTVLEAKRKLEVVNAMKTETTEKIQTTVATTTVPTITLNTETTHTKTAILTNSTTTTMNPLKEQNNTYSWIIDNYPRTAMEATTNATSAAAGTKVTTEPKVSLTTLTLTTTMATATHSVSNENKTHPLDYPTSLENMLESFERSGVLKPFVHPVANESFPNDSSMLAANVETAAAKQAQQDLINTFGELDAESAAKNGAKLNPTNTMSLNADDAQLMTLCERMAKRLRENDLNIKANSSASTLDPQFTSRGPGGFPVTGESMKASAQFMFNPNFGVPSIPVCFYLTPANFRLAPQMVPMWLPSYSGTPNFYSGSSGPFMGAGAAAVPGANGNGMFLMPQNFGGTANFFGAASGTGGGSFQHNAPNIFSKNASSHKQQQPQRQQQQQQQFYCTYMQNGVGQPDSNNDINSSMNPLGAYSNPNFKLRSANQNSSAGIIYASYAGVPVQLNHKDKFKCELADQVACLGGNECVREGSWCDGLVDCSDASDEAACTCPDRLSEQRLCDGYADCPLGEDETGCYGCGDFMYSCYANHEEYVRFNRSTVSMCYSRLEKCDGFTNCLNGRDELECSILAGDVMHQMSNAVSSSEGFLYHNYKGEWYPVCNNAERWAIEACHFEGGYVQAPNITYRELSLSGPFIEPSIMGNAHMLQSCQQRRDQDTLVDHVPYVACAPVKCGKRKKTVETSLRPRSKRQDKSHSKQQTVEEPTGLRIVGGKHSSSLEWPFVVAVYRNGNFHCGGTIYTERWLISAAHCAVNYHKYHYEVRAGLLRRSSYAASTQIRTVSHIVVHKGYDRLSMRNDMAMFRLVEPLRFNRWIKPICLPDIGRTTISEDWIWGPPVDTLCTVVGWGAVREKGPGSDQLREVILPIRKDCLDRPDKESESICAGDLDGGRDACQGDSGGPLFCPSATDSDEWYLAGVVSHGNGCARPGQFGVYTRVALYLDWIALTTVTKLLPQVQPLQLCPGYECVWGGKHCIPKTKRCNRFVDCLGGEDEVGCTYNLIPDVSSMLNGTTTTESDYFPMSEVTTDSVLLQQIAKNVSATTKSANEATSTTETQTTIFEENATPFLVEIFEEKTINLTVDESKVTTIAPQLQEVTSRTTNKTISKNSSNAPSSMSTTQTLPTATEAMEQLIKITEQAMTQTSKATPVPPPLTSSTTTSTTPENSVATASVAFTTDSTIIRSSSPMTTTTESLSSTKKPKFMPQIPGKFICQKIPQIIELKHRCDRVVDCEDGTDETSCNCRDYLKDSLNILVCDGKPDCEDLTDEEECNANCQANEFLCPLSKICLPRKKRCDGVSDCTFNEDEKDCFALADGEEELHHLDHNLKLKFTNAGFFSRNTNGVWRIVCAHETSYYVHSAKTAADVCALLGFKGFKFYNTTNLKIHDHAFVPIDPDFVGQSRMQAHFAGVVEDSLHLSSDESLFPPETKHKLRIQTTGTAASTCLGLYIECNATSIKPEPLKTLSAGPAFASIDGIVQVLKPALQTNVKPNVLAKPESPTQLVSKKEEILDKLEHLIEAKKNMTVLVNNTLHEAVEELHWPWLIDVYANGKLWCAGVLLDKRWVMVHELCFFGLRLDTDYVAALFGGGKTKNTPHMSPSEQIKRIDCFQAVPNSDVILFHLEKPVHFSKEILPIYLPESGIHNETAKHECMAVLHDEQTGRIKTVQIVEQNEDAMCRNGDVACYRLMENQPSEEVLRKIALSAEDIAAISSSVELKSDGLKTLHSSLTMFTSCTQFGSKKQRDFSDPIDQGILVCRDEYDAWFPASLFSYNNSDCRSFKEPFPIRSLENVYETLQNMIEQSKCNIVHMEPVCNTFRCPLGKCLAHEELCNGHHDCHDGSDEETKFCLEYKKVCDPSEMRCRTSKKCIPKTKFCDHIADCEDFTDEPTICSCFTYLKATDPSKICDGVRNCWDKSDESPVICNCTTELFSCGTSTDECIPRDFVCDKETDCPNGADERYCFGIEEPLVHPPLHSDPKQLEPIQAPKYGQVIEQTYGVWHTKCFPRSSPPDISEVRQICKKLGYTPFRQPSYRLLNDANEIIASNESQFELWPRSSGNDSIAGRYRDSTKAVVASKFSSLQLNDQLTLFLKPSRPIATLARWNETDSKQCLRLEINCG